MKSVLRLDGWQRLSVASMVLWLIVVAGVAAYELQVGTDSRMFVTRIGVLRELGYEGRNGIFQITGVINGPVLDPFKLFLATICVPAFVAILLYMTKWVADGFKISKRNVEPSLPRRVSVRRPDPLPPCADLLHLDAMKTAIETCGEISPSVGTGTGALDSPLVINQSRDCVSLEYALAHRALDMLNVDYKLRSQSVSRPEGRVVDELIFNVKEKGAETWAGTRHFFFDITNGYGNA